MEAGHDDDLLTNNAIEDPIREPLEQRAPRIAMHHGVHLGPFRHSLELTREGGQELLAKAGPLFLVPAPCLFHLGCGGRAKKQLSQRVERSC